MAVQIVVTLMPASTLVDAERIARDVEVSHSQKVARVDIHPAEIVKEIE